MVGWEFELQGPRGRGKHRVCVCVSRAFLSGRSAEGHQSVPECVHFQLDRIIGERPVSKEFRRSTI